jgi:hypothetical protein
LEGDGSYAQVPNGPAKFFRKIVMTRNVQPPYGSGPGAMMEVTSVVGWIGKGCRPMTGTPLDPATTNCNISVTERLTNWKDYR